MAQSLDDLLMQTETAIANSQPPPSVPISTDNNAPGGSEPNTSGRPRVIIGPDVGTSEPTSPNVNEGFSPSEGTTPTPGTPTGTTPPDENALPSPGPDDETGTANLDRLDALAEQAMKEKGYDGYVPPVNSLANDPQAQATYTNAVKDFFAGFNADLAKVVALPEEMTARGLALLGVDYMEHGSPTQRTMNTLNRMGIPAYEVDNLANKLGQGALPALATWAAIQASAPYLAARQGVTTASYLGKQIGEWALQHPIFGLWLNQTSSAGGTVVSEKVSKNPLAVMGGELAGGGFGSAAARAGGGIARLSGRLVNPAVELLADNLPTNFGNVLRKYNPLARPSGLPPAAAEAVAEPGVGIRTVQNYAENQVAGLKLQMDEAVERAINSIPTNGSSAMQQRVAHANLQEAERISNRLVSHAWERTPMRQRIPVSDMRRDIIQFAASLNDTPSVRPNDLLREGLHISSPIRDQNTGRMVRATPTIRRLRDYIASIRNAIVREQASDAPRDGYIRNLNQLRDIVENSIERALPRDTSIAQARAASRLHHDMFSRGPISQVLSKRYNGDFRVNPAESVDTLADTEGGLQAVRNMVRTLSANKLTSADEKRILATLEQDIERSLRNAFREQAANGGPKAAVKYQGRMAMGIRAFANVAAQLQLAAQKVQTALDVRQSIEKSALARFAETDPEKAIANIFAQKNPAEVARQLVRNFKGDVDALAGLRNGIVKELLSRSRNDPLKLREYLNVQRYRDLVQEVLSPDQFRRLQRIVNDTIRLTSGEDKGFNRQMIGRYTLLGRIVGAQVGRFVSRHTGGGTIQVPGIFSRAGSQMAERLFRVTSPEDMLTMAIIDPEWERLLYSRLPISTKEMRAAAKQYRRLLAGMDTARRETQARLSKEGDNIK